MSFKTKGQIWSNDLLMMTLLLLLAILMFVLVWNAIAARWNREYTYTQLWQRANDVTSTLATTAGYPPAWETLPVGEEDEFERIGLAYTRGRLSEAKLERAQQWSQSDYTAFRDHLLLAPYDIYITVVEPLQNQTLTSLGMPPPENATQVQITRLSVYNDTLVHFTVNVWDD